MNKLRQFLADQRMPQSKFAAMILVAPITVSRYLRGERLPAPEIQRRIFFATGGAVTPNDWAGIGDEAVGEGSHPTVTKLVTGIKPACHAGAPE